MPKWKFRLAADLVLEIQPKVTRVGRKFAVRALHCAGASIALLATPRSEMDCPYVMLSGVITDVAAGCQLKLTRVGWQHGHDDPSARRLLRQQVIAAFSEGRFNRFDPAMLLAPHCLICGKALSDPVSQARFIGPECADTNSVHVPWVLDAAEATAQR
jgi:hypothetical protein